MDIPQSWLDTESLSKLDKKPQVFAQNAVKKKWKSQEAEWGSARGPTVFERERLRAHHPQPSRLRYLANK